jgi:hypothetical protein
MADPNVEAVGNETDELEVVDTKTGTKSHPETVPWDQYVKAKETIGNKVTKLEEKLKNTVSKEEHDKVQTALTTAQTELTKAQSDLKTFQDASVADKKKTLADKGVPEAKLKDLNGAELDKIYGILSDIKPVKPGADTGGGGSATTLKGSPLELATQAYASSNK